MKRCFQEQWLLSNFYKINVLWLSNFSELHVLGKVMVTVGNDVTGLSSILVKLRLE